MTDRPPAGLIEVHFPHNAASEHHTWTCSNASGSLLFADGRERVGLKLAFTGGKDAQGGDVLDVLYAEVSWVIVRPRAGES